MINGLIFKNLRKLKFLMLVLRGCLYEYRFLGSEKIILFLGAQSEDSLTKLNVCEVPGFIPILFTKQLYLTWT